MHGIILVKLGDLVDLAHVDDDGGDAIEQRVTSSLVGFPRIVKM